MKLLGWMHRKFRQNSGEPIKDYSIGQPSLDDQQYYQKSNYGTKPIRQTQRDHSLRKPFAGLATAKVEEEEFEEESTAAVSDLFHGFLTIGTFGSDPLTTNPSTPTFATSVENIAEKGTEVTENELKLVNEELDKVLGAEAKEDCCNDSSGRNSHVSTGRSSQGSTITLSGKALEGTETNGNGTTVHPLQGYLFGTAIELPGAATAVKKEHRTSLGELFQRTKTAEESSRAKCERGEKRIEKEPDKSAVQLMKKMLKKRVHHASSRRSAGTGGTVDSTSAETKLHKILHMFHRKVHPESSTTTRKAYKTYKEMKSICHGGGYNNGDCMLPDADITIVPLRPLSKESICQHKSQSIQSQLAPFILGSENH